MRYCVRAAAGICEESDGSVSPVKRNKTYKTEGFRITVDTLLK